jgi:hypothetical protein
MQQRQLRLGDILDDYCPRERRVTNHAVVAMIGDDVKRTRCTTCDAEHEYKNARVPRQRRKPDVIGPHPATVVVKRIAPLPPTEPLIAEDLPDAPDDLQDGEEVPLAALALPVEASPMPVPMETSPQPVPGAAGSIDEDADARDDDEEPRGIEEGPVHRRLIRAQLPRIEGQVPPPSRQTPDFTIGQPGGRPKPFGFRQQRDAFYANRSSQNGNGMSRDQRGGQRPPGGRPGGPKRHGPGRKRSK